MKHQYESLIKEHGMLKLVGAQMCCDVSFTGTFNYYSACDVDEEMLLHETTV